MDVPQRRPEFLRFRPYFIPFDPIELEREQSTEDFAGVQCVPFDIDYVEDENGDPISMYDIYRHVSGEDEPVVLGEVDTVLRRSPAPMMASLDWTEDTSNLFMHFFQIMKVVRGSDWRCTPKFVKEHRKNGFSRLVRRQFPSLEATVAILPFVRQLYASDELFIHCCKAYGRHCGDRACVEWVNNEKRTFCRLLNEPIPMLHDRRTTGRALFNMFLYGAGIMHAQPKGDHGVSLKELVSEYGQTQVLMAFHSSLSSMICCATNTAALMWRDVARWRGENSLPDVSRVILADLFSLSAK